MKNGVVLLLILLTACKKEVKNNKGDVTETITEQVEKPEAIVNDLAIEQVDFNGLKPLLEKTDKTYVVNFWATWCAPCVKELPYFETINREYSNKNVEVILVSLDFPDLYETRLLPFVAKKELKSRVILLDDPDSNTWIPMVNDKWSGAIPATLIYNKDKKLFYEKSFTLEELKTEVNKFLK